MNTRAKTRRFVDWSAVTIALLLGGGGLVATVGLSGCGNKAGKSDKADATSGVDVADAASSAATVASSAPDAGPPAPGKLVCGPAEKGGHFGPLQFKVDERRAVSAVAVDPCGQILLAGSFKKSIAFGGAGSEPLESKGGEDLFLAKFGTKGEYVYSKVFGGKGRQAIRTLATDARGEIYLSGILEGPMDLETTRTPEPGGTNFILARLSHDGTPAFSRVISTKGQGSSPIAMDVDAQGTILLVGKYTNKINLGGGEVGSGFGGIFVGLYNQLARHRASIIFPAEKFPNEVIITAVSIDKDGNAIIAGSFENDIDFGAGKMHSAGKTDMFLAKLTPAIEKGTFNCAWSKHFGDGDPNVGAGVSVDGDGNILFMGTNERKVPGEPAWKRLRIVEVMKFDGTGKRLWGKSFGGGGGKEGIDDPVLAVSGKTVALVGTLTENTKFGSKVLEVPKGQKLMFAARIDDKGEVTSAELSEAEVPSPRTAVIDAQGELIVTGNLAKKPAPGGPPFSIFLEKFSQ